MRKQSVAPSDPVRVCLVGVGLIGGSLGMALRRARRRGRRAYHVVGFGRRAGSLREARALGAVDEIAADLPRAVRGADIVVLCVPVQDILPLARRVIPHLKAGAVLTDVGSVKAPIVSGMRRLLPVGKRVDFVGGHPMAGSEKIGVRNGSAVLFRGATCALTGGRPSAVRAVERMWRDAGARCEAIRPERHDDYIAITSHLPHVLAFALVAQVSALARRDRRINALVAGSFRDMTRVAAADPRLWSGVLSLNRGAVAPALKAFVRVATDLTRRDIRTLSSSIARIAREKKALR